MRPVLVIQQLDIFEDLSTRRFATEEVPVMRHRVLRIARETFNNRIIVAITSPADARFGSDLSPPRSL